MQSAAKSAGPPVSLPPEDSLVDELLSAPALPPPEQQLATAPLQTIGKPQHDGGGMLSRMGMVVGVGVGGAIVLVIILLFLIYLSTML